jgi:plasmid stabilization system protein ParE
MKVEWTATARGHRIIYLVKPDGIDVLAVIHGARDLLRAAGPDGGAE